MSVTLQINSKEALERLIGDDEETLLALRQSCVEAYGKHKLKCLKGDVDRSLAKEVGKLNNAMSAEIKKAFEQGGFKVEQNLWGTAPKALALGSDERQLLRKKAKLALEGEISEAIKGAVEDLDMKAYIQKRVNEEVRIRIVAGVKERIKQLTADLDKA